MIHLLFGFCVAVWIGVFWLGITNSTNGGKWGTPVLVVWIVLTVASFSHVATMKGNAQAPACVVD